MAYVDLNPVRAGIAGTPEASEYTSIRARRQDKSVSAELRASIRNLVRTGEIQHFNLSVRPLMPVADATDRPDLSSSALPALPIEENDCLALVDLTGRIEVQGERGSLDSRLAPILERIGLSSEVWPIPAIGLKTHLQKQAGSREKLT